jgi:uncharacterized protein YutE (UPF0331/DUF86 family)
MQQPDRILLAKAVVIDRCVRRAQGALANSSGFEIDIDAQDIVVLNIIRACEASIDIALRLVRVFDAGLPSSSGDSFTLLAQQGLIDADFAGRLKRMVGFRNVAVHDYTTLNLDIVASVVTESLGDLLVFSGVALSLKIPPELI